MTESDEDGGRRARFLRLGPDVQPALAPPLSEQPSLALPDATSEQVQGTIWIGLADLPDQQRQQTMVVDLRAGAVLFAGPAGSGRTSALLSVVESFVAGWDGRAHVCWLSGDYDALTDTHRIEANPTVSMSNPDLLSHVLDQLDLVTIERTIERRATLVVLDRLDAVRMVRPRPEQIAALARTIGNCHRAGIAIAASTDSRSTLEGELLRAFRHTFALSSENPSLMSTPEAVEVKRFMPTSRLRWGERQASVTLGEPAQRSSPIEAALPKVGLGVDRLRHEPVEVDLSRPLAIVGPAESGRTTTMLTIAWRAFQAAGASEPLMYLGPQPLPEQVSWLVDVGAEARRRDQVTSLAWLQSHFATTAGPRLLLVDDVPELDYYLPDSLQASALNGLISDLLRSRGVSIVATGGFELINSRSSWMAELYFSRRNYVVTGADLLHGESSVRGTETFRPRSGRIYSPGDLIVVNRRSQAEVRLEAEEAPSRLAEELVRR